IRIKLHRKGIQTTGATILASLAASSVEAARLPTSLSVAIGKLSFCSAPETAAVLDITGWISAKTITSMCILILGVTAIGYTFWPSTRGPVPISAEAHEEIETVQSQNDGI